MTSWLVTMYLAAAVSELGGVGLVVKQIRRATHQWSVYSSAVEAERQAMARDPRSALDPFITRYGVSPNEIRRATIAIQSLLSYSRGEQILTVAMLVAGILLGLGANLLSLVN